MRRHGNNQHRDAGPRLGHVCVRAFLFALALGLIASCGTTVDPIGYNGGAGLPLKPLTGPASYPNPFKDRGYTDDQIATKIDMAFVQLFHGDPATQAIYFPAGTSTNSAYIQDIIHNDVRTEGIGLGMLIAVELDHRDELDSLWTYAKTTLQVQGGSTSGYFNSFCDNAAATTMPCLDPFGLQQMTMALILAHDRYTLAGAPAGPVDYGADARDLLTLMRHKVDQNGGVVDGVTDTFDQPTSLVLNIPNTSAAGVGRPSIEMPGYYDLWAQATGDPFWTQAATAARDYWRRTANPTTGLTPIRATFAGTPVAGYETFSSEAYRAQIAMALDQIWTGGDGWSPGEADRLLAFFASQGSMYGMSFTIDGTTVVNALHDPALVAANGISFAIARNAQPAAFVDPVWSMPVPNSTNRYFAGLLYLVALLVMGGQMRVL